MAKIVIPLRRDLNMQASFSNSTIEAPPETSESTITSFPVGPPVISTTGVKLVVYSQETGDQITTLQQYPSIDFSESVLGEEGNIMVFVIRNDGDEILTTGEDLVVPQGFTIVQNVPASVNPGESKFFEIRVDTSYQGFRGGWCYFSTNDFVEQFRMMITGYVVGSEVSSNPQDPWLQIYDTSSPGTIITNNTIGGGKFFIGSPISDMIEYNIKNAGILENLKIISVSYESTPTGFFSFDVPTNGTTLSPGEFYSDTMKISLYWLTPYDGDVYGRITIHTNDPLNPIFIIIYQAHLSSIGGGAGTPVGQGVITASTNATIGSDCKIDGIYNFVNFYDNFIPYGSTETVRVWEWQGGNNQILVYYIVSDPGNPDIDDSWACYINKRTAAGQPYSTQLYAGFSKTTLLPPYDLKIVVDLVEYENVGGTSEHAIVGTIRVPGSTCGPSVYSNLILSGVY